MIMYNSDESVALRQFIRPSPLPRMQGYGNKQLVCTKHNTVTLSVQKYQECKGNIIIPYPNFKGVNLCTLMNSAVQNVYYVVTN